ncbi:hypothetical protein GcM1_241152 [Golovinomyces cichoracearum]|uniref:TMEM14 protein-like protein n=1 Tax=Golovinomyces cichoracearum TaxID=62708 RepID=A0A420IHY5_9PEZI|nr:hypothetical protein GcM1_241152 [Golovinomyces cichoracearum]
MRPEISAYVLGALTAGGGTWGYIKTGSIPSISFGMLIGTIYLTSGYQIQNRNPHAHYIALFASFLLAGASIPRAIKTRKYMPAGLSLLALYGLYTFGTASFRSTKKN